MLALRRWRRTSGFRIRLFGGGAFLVGDRLTLGARRRRGFERRGYALVKLERLPEAVEIFSNRPNDLDALCDLGNALQLLGKPQEALARQDLGIAGKRANLSALPPCTPPFPRLSTQCQESDRGTVLLNEVRAKEFSAISRGG
jgi:hypothetical protein